MEKHYICTGECGGVSSKDGDVCHAENCSESGKPFVPCECEDGNHKAVKEAAKNQ